MTTSPAFPPTPRRCPRCTFTLVPHQVGAVEVDTCPRCRGVFIERHEGDDVLGPHSDVAAWAAAGTARSLGLSGLPCPADDRLRSHGHMSAWRVTVPDGGDVEVDTCLRCRGLWLDAGEARRLRGVHGRAPSAPSVTPLPTATPGAPAAPPSTSTGAGEPPTGHQKPGVGWYLFQLFTAMPLEVYNPKRRVAAVCIALITACLVVFGLELAALGTGDAQFIARWSAVGNELLAGRQLPTVLTHMFMHGSVAHLLGNLWFLWTFGDNVEDRVGRTRFLALYVAFGLAAMVLQLALMEDRTVPLLGASGAIAGLMGAYLALFPKTRVYQVIFFFRWRMPIWLYVGGWAAMNAALGVMELNHMGPASGVAWWAHIGGFVAGLAWGLLFGAAYRDGAELRR